MTLWLVRAGEYGQREDFNLENNVVAIGWENISDLRNFNSKEEIADELLRVYPEEAPGTLRTWTSELWSFSRKISVGDFVATPIRERGIIHLGKIVSEYSYQENNPIESRHVRGVDWINEYPRTSFDQDILLSLGSLLAVGRVRRERVDERISALIAGRAIELPTENGEDAVAEEIEDLEQFARDKITGFINKRFKEHDLERLVAAVLRAQGYKLRVSPEGPDGGVDILAGSGPLGFDQPRLAVQVKSGKTPVDVDTVRAFGGVMSRFKAEHGLIVAWNGFRGIAEKEAVTDYFKLRLWGAEDLVKNIQEYYDKMPEDIQAELPLKRIWILLPEEQD